MNGVDYTKQLARDREYFQDANKKLKDASDRRVEDTDKRADHVMAKQREGFIEDKAELESSYKKSLDTLKDKTRATLANTNVKQQEQQEKERESFTQESLKKSKDFDQRLHDIKSSYKKAFDSETDRHEDLTKNLKDKYGKNVDAIQVKTEEQLKDYQDRLTGAGADLKEQYNRERQQLVRAQEERLTDSYKDSSQKRAELKERIANEHKKTIEAHEAEAAHQRDYSQGRMTNMQNKFQERFETMSKDYSDRTDNLAKNSQREAIKTNREHQEDMVKTRRDYNDSLRQIELEKRRRDNGSGQFAQVVHKQQGLKDEVIHQNKMKHLRNELTEAQRGYEHRASSESKAFNEELKAQSSEAVARQERKLNEANADKIVTVAHERENAEKEIQNREHQNRLDKSGYESQLMNERKNASERINKLKETFHASMKKMEEKHTQSLEDVTKVSNADKTDFMRKVQENRSKELFEMKRDFNKMMDATVQDYEQRLATYQRDNDYLKLTMDQKVQGMMEQTSKEIESQKKIFEDRRAADVKGQQLLADQRESQLKHDIRQLNLNFQRKIDKVQVENDSRLKLITNDYESKLKELRASGAKELGAKDTANKIELEKLKQAYEQEYARMVGAFENEIQSLKQTHKAEVDGLAQFKRLS